MKVSRPINTIDPPQSQITKLIPLIHLMQRVDVHMPQEISNKVFPPVPGYERREEAVLVREFEVQGRGDEPDVGEEKTACGSV
jgi:hypothetical protein